MHFQNWNGYELGLRVSEIFVHVTQCGIAVIIAFRLTVRIGLMAKQFWPSAFLARGGSSSAASKPASIRPTFKISGQPRLHWIPTPGDAEWCSSLVCLSLVVLCFSILPLIIGTTLLSALRTETDHGQSLTVWLYGLGDYLGGRAQMLKQIAVDTHRPADNGRDNSSSCLAPWSRTPPCSLPCVSLECRQLSRWQNSWQIYCMSGDRTTTG